MNDEKVDAFPVSGVLGTKLTEDKTHVLVGFKQPTNDDELVLAIGEKDLKETILALLDSVAQFPRGAGPVINQLAIKPDRYEIGKTQNGEIALSFRYGKGTFLTFALDLLMAQRVQETLNTMLPASPTMNLSEKQKH